MKTKTSSESNITVIAEYAYYNNLSTVDLVDEAVQGIVRVRRGLPQGIPHGEEVAVGVVGEAREPLERIFLERETEDPSKSFMRRGTAPATPLFSTPQTSAT